MIYFRFTQKKYMKKLHSYSDKNIFSYFTHTHTDAVEVWLQPASDSRLSADGCDLICLLLPAAQPRLHNFIALFGKLISGPPLATEETGRCEFLRVWNENTDTFVLPHFSKASPHMELEPL